MTDRSFFYSDCLLLLTFRDGAHRAGICASSARNADLGIDGINISFFDCS